MQNLKYEVVGIGNAIVDILAKIEDKFLKDQGLIKSSMTLIDQDKAKQIYNDMPQAIEISGGSAANTIAGMASFGAKVAFVGKVGDDDLGKIFEHDLKAQKVNCYISKTFTDEKTARSFVLVTKDAERTMATYLGAARYITVKDIDEQLIAQAKILYIEGYLWDDEKTKQAILKAIDIAKKYKVKIAFTLSDGFCVERHRDDFKRLFEEAIDILFANEDEVRSLYEEKKLEVIIEKIKNKSKITNITCGNNGAIIVSNNEIYRVAAEKNIEVLDTTGAGDLYASGFLYGYSNGLSLEICAKLGNMAAAEIISHMGARPEVNLYSLALSKGLIKGINKK